MATTFVVVSCICVGTDPLDYTSVRSVFSNQERYAQTLDGIRSIRTHCPTANIVHLECGNHNKMGMSVDKIRDEVDLFLDLSTDEKVSMWCNSPHKSRAELVSMSVGLRKVLEQNPSLVDGKLFKISGRYLLTENFSASNFSETHPSFMVDKSWSTPKCVSVLYSVPSCNVLLDFCNKIEAEKSIPYYLSMEDMLYIYFNQSIREIDVLGCSGRIAVSGEEWSK